MATIFDGMDQVVDEYLNLNDAWAGSAPRFGHLATLLQLTKASSSFGTGNLIDGLHYCSQSVWEIISEEQRRCRSMENWRSAKCLEYGEQNPSLEVVLERHLARATDDNWWNQVPVDSGVLDSQGRRNVDLVHREGEKFSIVELKWNANTPLSAAIQVVKYGVAYLFFRQFILPSLIAEHGDGIRSAIMSAQTIDLVVLAPTKYYEGFVSPPSWLEQFERRLNVDLEASAARQAIGIPVTFRFESFPPEFEWSLRMAADQSQHGHVKQALEQRTRVFPS